MKLTNSQRQLLADLSETRLDEVALRVRGYAQRTVDALEDIGLIDYHPYADPRGWGLTQEGWDALYSDD